MTDNDFFGDLWVVGLLPAARASWSGPIDSRGERRAAARSSRARVHDASLAGRHGPGARHPERLLPRRKA